MGAIREVKHRGVSELVLERMNRTQRPYTSVTMGLELDLPPTVITGALNYLYKEKQLIQRLGYNTYRAFPENKPKPAEKPKLGGFEVAELPATKISHLTWPDASSEVKMPEPVQNHDAEIQALLELVFAGRKIEVKHLTAIGDWQTATRRLLETLD